MPSGGPFWVQQSRPAQGQELEDLEQLAAAYEPPTVQEQLAEQLIQAQEQKQPEYRPQEQALDELYAAAEKALRGVPLVRTIKNFTKLVSTRGKLSKDFISEIEKYTTAIKEAADEHYRSNRMLPQGGQFSLKPGQLAGSKVNKIHVVESFLLRLLTRVKDSIFPVALKDEVLNQLARFRNMYNIRARDLIGAIEDLIDGQKEMQELKEAVNRLNN